MSVVATRWYHIRHAPVPDGGNIYGQRDLDCDCSNAAVFHAVAKVVPRDAVWVTSDLRRAKQTAAAVVTGSLGELKPAEMPAFTAFNEQHLGDWQGRNRLAFRAERGLTAQSFWLARAHERTPNGESFLDLMARVHPLIDTLTEQNRGRNIVAVSHGGTIRAAIAHALGLPAETSHAFTIDNCSITVLEHLHTAERGGVWRVEAVNYQPWKTTTAGVGTHA
jgi:broad specificity phosphatase PhoE